MYVFPINLAETLFRLTIEAKFVSYFRGSERNHGSSDMSTFYSMYIPESFSVSMRLASQHGGLRVMYIP